MTERGLVLQPLTLLARTTFFLGISAMLIAVIATVAMYAFVIDPISEQSADDEAALLVLSAQTWVELPPAARPYFELEMAESHDIIISEARQVLPPADLFSRYYDLLRDRLAARLESDVVFQASEDLVWLDVSMGGHELQIGFSPVREEIQPLYVALIIAGLGAAIVFFTSLAIVRRIASPLVRVADLAERFRGAQDIEPLPESGPRELRSLIHNFNTMAQEISTLLANRTTLLAGISHDLRTPLTRMRLALALLPPDVDADLVARFERNLESMDQLIGDALRFARGTREAPEPLSIAVVVREVVHTFDQPIVLREQCADDVTVGLAPSAFRRVLVNLIANATQYGDKVCVTVFPDRVLIADNGPGIPADEREQVFQPFYRLDEARQAATGGSGLGLAIVAQLCQAHGWQVSLGESELGGTVATVEIGQG